MFNLNNYLKLVFLVFVSFSYSQDVIDTISYSQKLRSGKFQFPFYLSNEDEIKFPIEYQIELNIQDLRDITIKNTNFYLTTDINYSSVRDTLEVLKSGDSLKFYPSKHVRFLYPESDRTYVSDIFFDGRFKYSKIKDSISQWSSYYEVELPHKWNLRNYPFDNQKLKVIFETKEDTSLVKISSSIQYPPKINQTDFKFLLDGFNIKDMTTDIEYFKSGVFSDNFIEGNRSSIFQRLIFNINIDRKGSFLYFKLFFGGFLSFLISFLVYFIDSRYFETRITLSLGGIFGAVGNKYFVENSMPAIQVLTKADIINNLVVIFIILNIFIVIGQHTKNINLWKFKNNKFAALFILIVFAILNYLTIII
mgnify:FL=1